MVKNNEYLPKLIVSLTSYPKRIGTVNQTIQSLMLQTVKPDKIILWLSEEQFPNRDGVPNNLSNLEGDSFEICWCDDLKSHKKYYYAFLRYPQDCIITVDDDCIYPNNLIEMLHRSYLKFPESISSIRARIIDWDKEGNLKKYEEWIHADKDCIGIPAMDLLPIGCGGILYTPHLINKEVFNKEYIMDNCLYTDDLWLKIMHAVNNVSTVLVSDYFYIESIEGSQENALWVNNCSGNNDWVMAKLIKNYNNFRKDGLLLSDILQGKYGVSLGKEIARRKEIEKNKIYTQLVKWRKVIIFGAGYFAKKTYDIMNNINGIEIVCFAVTELNGNPNTFEGHMVCEIDRLQNYAHNSIVVVATDEKYHNEIINTLLKNQFEHYLLITDSILKIMK